jgi:hypothetical protein
MVNLGLRIVLAGVEYEMEYNIEPSKSPEISDTIYALNYSTRV